MGADPVNTVDLDGNEGKPLILYQEEHSRFGSLTDRSTELMHEYGSDAHFVALSDFMTGKVPYLPGWEGDVIIQAHMRGATREIVIERIKGAYPQKTRSAFTKTVRSKITSEISVLSDAFPVGANLRKLAESRGVTVHNVFAEGCGGGRVAERLLQGYVAAGPAIDDEITGYGLKEEYGSMLKGPINSQKKGEFRGLKKIRFYWGKMSRGEVEPAPLASATGGQPEFDQLRYENAVPGEDEHLRYVEGDEFRALGRGEISRTVEPFLDVTKLSY